MGATDSREHIVAELKEMIRDPADFYKTRPTVDRVELANSIVHLLEDEADELERLRAALVHARAVISAGLDV